MENISMPKIIKKFIIAYLTFPLLGCCSIIQSQKNLQPTNTQLASPILSNPIPSQGDSNDHRKSIMNNAYIIPSIMTPKEFAIREEQLKIAKGKVNIQNFTEKVKVVIIQHCGQA